MAWGEACPWITPDPSGRFTITKVSRGESLRGLWGISQLWTVSFYSSPVGPAGEGGIPPEEWGWPAHSLEEDTTGHAGTQGAELRRGWPSRGCGRWAGYSQEGEVTLGPMGGCDWLIWIIPWAGWGLTPTTQLCAGACLVPWQGSRTRGSFLQEQGGEGNLTLAFPRPSWSQMSRQHIIQHLILGLIPRVYRWGVSKGECQADVN